MEGSSSIFPAPTKGSARTTVGLRPRDGPDIPTQPGTFWGCDGRHGKSRSIYISHISTGQNNSCTWSIDVLALIFNLRYGDTELDINTLPLAPKPERFKQTGGALR